MFGFKLKSLNYANFSLIRYYPVLYGEELKQKGKYRPPKLDQKI